MRALLKEISGAREVFPERGKKNRDSKPPSDLDQLNLLVRDLVGRATVERQRGTVLRPSEYWTKPLK
jgi:hypothetical protein